VTGVEKNPIKSKDKFGCVCMDKTGTRPAVGETCAMPVIRLPRIHVDLLRENDLDKAAVFLLKLWREIYRHKLPHQLVEERSTGYFRDYLEQRAATCRLAWMGDRLSGMVTTQQNCVDNLWVAPRYRRRHVGTALLEAAVEALRERGYRFVQAGCEDFNEAAMTFFDAAGWDYVGSDSITLAPGHCVNAMVFSCRLTGNEDVANGTATGDAGSRRRVR
jgi:GNAT superfamily N-acetyltransferase